MKKILTLCSILLMVGCGGRWVAVQTLYPVPRPEPKVISIQFYGKNYKIGALKTAFIGQEIIKVRPYKQKISYSYFYEKNASSGDPLYIEAQYGLSKFKINKDTLKNDSIAQSVEIERHMYNIIYLSGTWGLLVDDNGQIFKSALYSYHDKMIFYPESISITPVKIDISTKKIKGPDEVVEINGIPFELIYSGKNDVSLNLTYREYTPDDIARSSFFQDITYRADAKNIRFKDFMIEIHEATNEKITYTVWEDRLDSGPVN